MVTVVIDQDKHGFFVHTQLSGGEVHARPKCTGPAETLHDLIHTLLAVYAELPESPVLRTVAGDWNTGGDQYVRHLEEAAVLAIQQFLDCGTRGLTEGSGSCDDECSPREV